MTKKPYPSDVQERFMVRLPDGMRAKIAAEAERNNRSMNSEIVARLERTFSQENPQSEEIVVTMSQFDKIIEDAIQRALAKAERLGAAGWLGKNDP